MASNGGNGNFAGTGGYGTGAGNTFNNSPSGGYGGSLGWGASGQTMSQGLFGGMNSGSNGASNTLGKDLTRFPVNVPPKPQQLAQALVQPAPVAPGITPGPMTPNFAAQPPGFKGFGVQDPYPGAYSNVYAGIPGPPRGPTGPYAGGGPTSGPAIGGMSPTSNIGAKGGFGGGINPNKGNLGGISGMVGR
jgi:hypothetical protein